MPPSLTTTIAEPAPTSPTKRTTTSILKSFVTPRRSRASNQHTPLSSTAPAMKQSPYLELRNDTFVPMEPLVPPHPPFFDSYSRGKPTEKGKTLLDGSGKGLHRKSASVASLGKSSPEPDFKKTSHRHSTIFSLPKYNGEDLVAKKSDKAPSTIDFSILKGVVRDRSPSKDKGKAPEHHSRPPSSGSNYGLRLFGGKPKVETNKENQAPSGTAAAPRAMGPPSAAPSQTRAPKPLPAVPPNGNEWQSPTSANNISLVVPQSLFTPRERPKSYLQQQRTSQYTPQEPRHPPSSRGSNSSTTENAQPSPRQSLDQQRQPTTPKTNGETIALYTPTAYTPSSQRNFRGQGYDVALKTRPKSAYYAPAPGPGFLGGGVEKDEVGIGGRRISNSRGSWDSSRASNDERQATGSSSGDSIKSEASKGSQGSKGSKSSKSSKSSKGSSERTKVDIDQAFEALMDNRGVAQNMRQKLRNLDPRVKQHFINNESELEKLSGAPTPAAKASEPTSHHTLGAVSGLFGRRPPTGHTTRKSISGIMVAEQKKLEEPFDPAQGIPDATAGKRARPRSRTFGLGKEKERSSSPTKKQRPGDSPTQPPPSPEKKKTMRLKNTLLGQPAPSVSTGDTLPTKGLRGGTIPASEFVTHLTLATAPSRKKDAGMKDVALPKLHKLRLYLRNETLRWVEEFVVLGGMNALIHVLYRCLDLEWREEHEDSVLHELLLCLKAISTCRKALEQLETVEEEFFTRLVDVIFDEERKGPSEFTTRGLVFSLLFTYMAAAPGSFTQVRRGKDTRATRARRILSYLNDKLPEESKRPIEFIEKIHTKRPYKRWHKEVNNVTKEVFWIFCHHDNVITVEVVDLQQGEPYEARHFPHERPPVPAAPYVGGVEWEATTYLATHLDLLNGIIASIETQEERNALRTDFKNSGWEKVMGRTLRTCKERLHGCSAVHDALKTWIKAAREDNWCTMDVETRNSPNGGGRVGLVPPEGGDQNKHVAIRESPAKRKSVVMDVPQVELDLPTLNLGARVQADGWAF